MSINKTTQSLNGCHICGYNNFSIFKGRFFDMELCDNCMTMKKHPKGCKLNWGERGYKTCTCKENNIIE